MRRLLHLLVVVLIVMAATPSGADGIDRGIRGRLWQRLHPWASFPQGSWQVSKIVTQSIDPAGEITTTSVTKTRTTLQESSDDHVTLEIKASVELGGRTVEATPLVLKQGAHGETDGADVKVTPLPNEIVVIEGESFPCRVEQVEIDGRATRTVTTTWYSDDVDPYVLRRETVTTDPSSGRVISETHAHVEKLNRLFPVRDEMRPISVVVVDHRHAGGRTVTETINCVDVPGGVVEHSSDEFDQNDRLIRCSTLKLIKYDAQPVRPTRRPRRR